MFAGTLATDMTFLGFNLSARMPRGAPRRRPTGSSSCSSSTPRGRGSDWSRRQRARCRNGPTWRGRISARPRPHPPTPRQRGSVHPGLSQSITAAVRGVADGVDMFRSVLANHRCRVSCWLRRSPPASRSPRRRRRQPVGRRCRPDRLHHAAPAVSHRHPRRPDGAVMSGPAPAARDTDARRAGGLAAGVPLLLLPVRIETRFVDNADGVSRRLPACGSIPTRSTSRPSRRRSPRTRSLRARRTGTWCGLPATRRRAPDAARRRGGCWPPRTGPHGRPGSPQPLTPTNLAQQPAAPTPDGEQPSNPPPAFPTPPARASSYEQAPARRARCRMPGPWCCTSDQARGR